MVIGPDHKWYMAHGDTGFKVEGTDGSKIEYKWGAMIRGELDGSKLEILAHNFRNPYEICVDSFGNAYCTDNDNDGNQSTRATWILEGGNYGWYGGPPIKREQLDPLVPKGRRSASIGTSAATSRATSRNSADGLSARPAASVCTKATSSARRSATCRCIATRPARSAQVPSRTRGLRHEGEARSVAHDPGRQLFPAG